MLFRVFEGLEGDFHEWRARALGVQRRTYCRFAGLLMFLSFILVHVENLKKDKMIIVKKVKLAVIFKKNIECRVNITFFAR